MPKRSVIPKRIKELSPAAKREIIVIIIIFIISVALSIPQYIKDCEAYDEQKSEQEMNTAAQGIGIISGNAVIQLY